MIIGMGTPIVVLPIASASLREVDLVGVFRYASTYAAAIEMLANKPPGLPDLEKLVTHRFKGMDEIKHAFEMAGNIKDEEGNLVIKVVVDMS
jgi:L-iditol 2-dehydrogenase